MARLTGEPFERVYAAGETIKQQCLLSDGSLLFAGEALWTLANLEALDLAMDDGGGVGSFSDRFARQLAHTSPEVRRLAGEVVLVQFLFPSDFKFQSKVRALREALGDVDKETLTLPIVQALSGGIGGANPGFNLNRYLDMKALIAVFRTLKGLPEAERATLLRDPWAFRAVVDNLPNLPVRGARHALLHILFPESFERIASTGQKRQIRASFGARLGGEATGNLDGDLAKIREILSQERGVGFDYYNDSVLRAQWLPDNTIVEPEDGEMACYWLNLPPDMDSLKNRQVGDRLLLAQNNPDGNPRPVLSCFTGAKAGDCVAGYESSPHMELTTILAVSQALHDRPEGTCLELEVTEKLGVPIPLDKLRESPHFTNSGILIQRGALSKISRAQFEHLTGKTSRPAGPENPPPSENEPLSSASDLFVDEVEFNQWVELWRAKKNLILQGPPGVGKTFIARHLAKALTGNDDPIRVQMIQFHQAYGYEDFVMGYRPTKTGGFEQQKGFFHNFCDAARSENAPYVLIIDEINRGNLSKIFGETLMLIEGDKRGERYALRLALHQEDDPRFFVPPNLYILGLMNNSDRSLAVVDYALRRRFSFVNLRPAFESEAGRATFTAFLKAQGTEEELIHTMVARIGALNKVITADLRNLGPDLCIGHSFFCSIKSKGDYLRVIEHEIGPLLREYWFDNVEKAEEEIGKLKA